MKFYINLLLGPLLLLLCIALLPFDFEQCAAIGTVLWMIVWWSTQVIPIGATSLLPLVLFPALGMADIKTTAGNYANPIIYLFLGGFVLGLAIEKWNLHKRIALFILRFSGKTPVRVIAGCMAATALLSMWISNTAATVMMLPIGISVVALLQAQFPDARVQHRFAVSLLLGLAFAANVGGIATIIGTPPNLVLAGVVSEKLNYEIGFAQWLGFALPLSIALFVLILVLNTKVLFKIPGIRMHGVGAMVSEQLSALGTPGKSERRVIIIFAATALLWILRAPLSAVRGLEFLSDALIAIAGALALFVVRGHKKTALMTWPDMQRMPWDILLLFGGGLSIAMGISITGTADLVGEAIAQFSHLHWLWVVLIITALAVFLTEVMSNVALVSLLLPIVIGIAPALGGDALQLAIPLTVGASCAFMLPIATPPNAIVFAGSYLKISDMIRAGIWLNICSILIVVAYCYLLGELFF